MELKYQTSETKLQLLDFLSQVLFEIGDIWQEIESNIRKHFPFIKFKAKERQYWCQCFTDNETEA